MNSSLVARMRRLVVVLVGIIGILADGRTATSGPGGFWYGTYGTSTSGLWGHGLYDSLATNFKMNCVLDWTASDSGGIHITNAGLKNIIIPSVSPPEDAFVWRFSQSHYLTYQAEGQTINFQWPSNLEYGKVYSTGGAPVSDQEADSGFML